MRTRHVVPALAFAVFAVPVVAGAQFPTTPPPPGPIKPTVFPPFRETTLPNGVRMIVVESQKQPVLSLTLALPAGDAYDPDGKDGLAGTTAELLTHGAGSRSAEEFNEAIERVGGSISSTTSDDFLFVTAGVLAYDAALAFDLLGDAVARPRFDSTELELVRTQTLSALQLQLSQPASIAQRTFARELYGASGYGRSATPASVRTITRDDIVAYHKARVRPGGALLVVAGDINLAQATKLATSAFKGWTGAAPAAMKMAAPAPRTASEIVLVHRPASVQANIVVGSATFAPTDPRFFALTVANRVLGVGASSRLFHILREQKSWTYGAQSGLSRPRGVGFFQAAVETRNAVADSALVELLAQIRRLRSEPVPPQELSDAKSALVGAFPLSIETASQVAQQVATARLLGLPSNYLATYRNRLAAVTAPQLGTTFRNTIQPDKVLIVVVGDATVLYDRMKAIAPVRLVRVTGEPMQPSDLVARAAPVPHFDLSKIAAVTDSFTIMIQGNPLGAMSHRVERTTDGIKVTDRMNMGNGMVAQSTDVMMSPMGEMRSVKQTGSVQGQQTSIDATYGGGRVKGSATTPTPAGLKSVTFDTTIVAGTIDDNATLAVLPSLPWSKTANFSLPVFGSGQGTQRTVSYKVTGTQSVTVPAGTFDAYVVETTGGPVPVTLYITTVQPYRVVKLAPAGAPMEIVLAK